MSTKDIEKQHHQTFENIKQTGSGGSEFWMACTNNGQTYFAIFQIHGYKGLYGRLDAKGIHARKGLEKSQQILDNMGSTELAANLFRATQTEDTGRIGRRFC